MDDGQRTTKPITLFCAPRTESGSRGGVAANCGGSWWLQEEEGSRDDSNTLFTGDDTCRRVFLAVFRSGPPAHAATLPVTFQEDENAGDGDDARETAFVEDEGARGRGKHADGCDGVLEKRSTDVSFGGVCQFCFGRDISP